jgi:calcium-dependent protein kinase
LVTAQKKPKLAVFSLRFSFKMQHTGLKGSIEPLLEEADIDKDGRISLSEFRKLLRTASMSNVPSPRGPPPPNPQAL